MEEESIRLYVTKIIKNKKKANARIINFAITFNNGGKETGKNMASRVLRTTLM